MKKISLIYLLLLPIYCFSQNTLQTKAITMQRLLAKKHYKPVVWNDTASVLLYNKWLKTLDDEKLFFTQKDIAVLDKNKTTLDDEMMGKGWDFFAKSTTMFKQRLQKVDSIIKQLTQKPFDFTKPDNMVWPFTSYALNDADLTLRWQKYLKWEVLTSIAKKQTDSNGVNIKIPANFAQLESSIRTSLRNKELLYVNNYLKVLNTEYEEKYLNAIAWCYDPYTNYMSTKKKTEFDAATSATEFSSGLDLEENDKGDITIDYLQPGSSAWRSGQLHKGDVIQAVTVDGKEKEVEEVSEEELTEILNGTSKTEVEITVKSIAGETKKVKLQKEKITDDEAIVKSYILHGKQNIGYINLPGFYSREDDKIENEKDIKFDGCANDVSKEIVKLKKDTIAGLILDLRFNGGGSMWEAMQLAGIFIDIGPVASVKDREEKEHALKDPNRGTIYDGPIIVLVNGASASASEFVSAALQDYNRAIILGGTTYGKGTAQYVYPLDTNVIDKNKQYDDFIKITGSKFYRVNGSTTQWTGVIPDITLPDLYNDATYKEKSNESALLPDNNKPAYYKPLPALPIANLAAKSEQRVKANEHFKMQNNFIRWQQQYKTSRTINLQWNTYIPQYNEAIKMYKQLQSDDKITATTIPITNNGFDWQRILLSTERSKLINKTHLEDIQEDITIMEAYNILMDWNNK